MKIKKISKKYYKGEVYNLELKSESDTDDLYWIEGTSGVVTHNCFPKDLSALIYLTEQFGTTNNVLKATNDTNDEVRSVRDWEGMKGRAVI